MQADHTVGRLTVLSRLCGGGGGTPVARNRLRMIKVIGVFTVKVGSQLSCPCTGSQVMPDEQGKSFRIEFHQLQHAFIVF